MALKAIGNDIVRRKEIAEQINKKLLLLMKKVEYEALHAESIEMDRTSHRLLKEIFPKLFGRRKLRETIYGLRCNVVAGLGIRVNTNTGYIEFDFMNHALNFKHFGHLQRKELRYNDTKGTNI